MLVEVPEKVPDEIQPALAGTEPTCALRTASSELHMWALALDKRSSQSRFAAR